jgi:transposase InsO family protein
MRYELTDFEWAATRSFLPNKPRGIPRDARASIGRYLNFYNGRRPHSSLDDKTPDQAYFIPLPLRLAA